MHADYIPAGMEQFPASNQKQFDYIKKIIDNSDYYLLIIGGKYGSLTEDGISYTEKEFDYAVEKEMEVLVFPHRSPEKLAYEKSEIDPIIRNKLNLFKEKAIKDRVVKFWTNTEELTNAILTSLIQTVNENPALGWIRGDDYNSLSSKEKKQLREEIIKEIDRQKYINKSIRS